MKERGQALILSIIVLLFVMLAVYMIASFGREVQQKIQAQTTADAMALSLATMEAQTFNYVAFANRAQVSQYITSLNMQAYVSYLSWWEILAAKIITEAKVLALIPYLTPLMTEVVTAAQNFKNVVGDLIDGFDTAGSGLETVVEDDNKILWATEIVMAEITEAQLASGGYEFFLQNANPQDPWTYSATSADINTTIGTAYNAVRFDLAFYGNSGALGLQSAIFSNSPDDSEKRVMTEEVNGTRATQFLLGRGIIPVGDSTLQNFFDIAGDVLGLVGKKGQSKLVSSSDVDTIFRTGKNDSALTTGSAMASADESTFNYVDPNNASVWASDGSSSHCRAKGATPQCLDQSQDANHSYKGIAPYLTYEAGLSANGGSGEDFHQPDVFVWLNKSMQEASLASQTQVSFNGSNNVIDTRAGVAAHQLVPLPEGINVYARAQAYYHRPGNWQEPPNLFNPFWHARLAPVAEGIQGVAAQVPVFGSITSVLTGIAGTTLVTH